MVGDGTRVRAGDGVGDGAGEGVGDGEGARQLQGAGIVFAGPIKLKVALAGHFIEGTSTTTDVIPFGGKLPDGGLKVIPLMPLPDVDQFRPLLLLWLVSKVLHSHPWFWLPLQLLASMKFDGFTDNMGGGAAKSLPVSSLAAAIGITWLILPRREMISKPSATQASIKRLDR